MTPKEREEMTAVIETAIENKLGALFVERKQHYEDHLFVKGARKNLAIAKTASIWVSVVTLVSAGLYAIFGIER